MVAAPNRLVPSLRPPRPTTLAAVAAVAFALVVGVLVAQRPALGVALVLGPCFLLIALRSVPLALSLWIVVVYAGGLEGLGALPNRSIYVLALCWIGAVAGWRAHGSAAFAAGRTLLVLAGLFLVWQVLTLVWAPVPADGREQFKDFFVIALAFLIVLSSVRTEQHLRWLAIAFVAGAAISVLGGIITGGLTSTQEFGDTATSRFSGGGGDPNYLAAMLVPAIALASGLAIRASTAGRLLLLGATVVIATGLAATQSRGGLLALAVTFLAALVLLRGRRLAVLAVVFAVIAGSAVFFVQHPAAWQRIHAVQDQGSGSGRTDIWHVALRVAEAHPITGVGLAQFPNVSPQYLARPGQLRSTSLIVDQGIVVHNVYLQLWAETGLVGLLLFLAIIVTSLRAALRAARELDALGDTGLAALARSVLLANIGVLAGCFFLSNILTRQIWLLLALGPALLVVARSRADALRFGR